MPPITKAIPILIPARVEMEWRERSDNTVEWGG